MRYAQILSSGGYVPERLMTNAEFDRLLGESVGDWLVENVGIRERHFMAEDQTTSESLDSDPDEEDTDVNVGRSYEGGDPSTKRDRRRRRSLIRK